MFFSLSSVSISSGLLSDTKEPDTSSSLTLGEVEALMLSESILLEAFVILISVRPNGEQVGWGDL